MALYEYQCENCGERFEVIQKFSDAPLTVHEKCGGKVERLISASAFQFKGSGWYVTDYARGSNAPANNGESKKPDAPASTTGNSDSGASSSPSSDKKASTPSDTK